MFRLHAPQDESQRVEGEKSNKFEGTGFVEEKNRVLGYIFEREERFGGYFALLEVATQLVLSSIECGAPAKEPRGFSSKSSKIFVPGQSVRVLKRSNNRVVLNPYSASWLQHSS